jgi:hypothetical protein
MIPYLYRFRPADAVLDSYEELARQEIFSTSEELNDPMAGYKDVFWSGDRHYPAQFDPTLFAMLVADNVALPDDRRRSFL